MNETASEITEPPPKQKKVVELDSSKPIVENNGTDALLFARLLETKNQLDRESRKARISNLSIV